MDSTDPEFDQRLSELVREHLRATADADSTLDSETLAAFVEGGLSPQERGDCERILAQGGAAYEEFLMLSSLHEPADTSARGSARPANADVNVQRKVGTPWRAIAAACLVVGVVSSGLVMNDRDHLQNQVAALESDSIGQQLRIAGLLADQHLQQTGSRWKVWVGDTSPFALEPGSGGRGLGGPDLSDEAAFSDLESSEQLTAEQLLRLAETQIRAGRLSEARTSLNGASTLSQSAEYRIAEACLLLAQIENELDSSRIPELRNKARLILEELSTDEPASPVVLFNLASLHLAEGIRLQAVPDPDGALISLEKSLELWDRYLEVETNATRRNVGERLQRIAEDRISRI